MLALRYRRAWLAALWLLVAVIVIGSLVPGPVVQTLSVSDRLEHFVAYLALTLLGAGLVGPAGYLAVALRAFALGAALELLQGLTASRQTDWMDVAANAAGVLAGWSLARWRLGGWAQRVEQRLAAGSTR